MKMQGGISPPNRRPPFPDPGAPSALGAPQPGAPRNQGPGDMAQGPRPPSPLPRPSTARAKAPRQVFDVLEQRVALPQTQLAGAHLQQPAGVIAAAAVKYRRRGGVVACVDAQCAHITPRPAAAPPLA